MPSSGYSTKTYTTIFYREYKSKFIDAKVNDCSVTSRYPADLTFNTRRVAENEYVATSHGNPTDARGVLMVKLMTVQTSKIENIRKKR